jgi:hypothetical protein
MGRTRMFQPLRRYVPSPITNPCANTFKSISAVNTRLHTSSSIARVGSTRSGCVGSSVVIMPAFARITTRMNVSNHRCVQNRSTASRAGCSSPNRKSARAMLVAAAALP